MLLKNINKSMGICNGSKMIISKLKKRMIEVVVIDRKNSSKKVTILIMIITQPDSRLSFKLTKRQFLILLIFAMSINKSQG